MGFISYSYCRAPLQIVGGIATKICYLMNCLKNITKIIDFYSIFMMVHNNNITLMIIAKLAHSQALIPLEAPSSHSSSTTRHSDLYITSVL